MRKLNCMENFKREIGHQVQVQEDESILLTGTINDCFHDIEVNIIADGETLVITDSRVVFRKAPSSYCDQVQSRLALLIGVTIGKGLTRSLNVALGGDQGCGNMRTLLMGLLPLAMNVKASVGITDEEDVLDTIHHHLQGSCVGYPVMDDGTE